ncbi:monovalent cation/H+ antiporter subunit D [Caldimonas brevitalea]|uniref:Monovalent cation/H+ antiporter subunit D n=1 Tax=Caldimonas brevitalea TaxID=413882 RepID=A0A0G3BU60_9BURK|nr:monovalent cation/H+ antiporter subunit D [Caldimonas brevitalea]AKJ30070.1 monovalent cation/H+ antiporter subunit D [Caldimonas brevitalea]
MSGLDSSGWSMAQVILLPVLLPLAAAGLMVGLGVQRRRAHAALGLLSCTAMVVAAVTLLLWVDGQHAPRAFGVYLPGNWPVPFGIVLAVDRLAALMLLLSAVTGLCSLLFSLSRWHRAGTHFHPLLQLQLMGLNGAFLTADLFNLFVFFEVLLAASYGLLLHGGGGNRVRAGLHYIAINLFASLLFLVGVSLLYGVTGTLNMADMAAKLAAVPDSDRGLLHAGAALLAVAFLAKAAIWPMNFWLPPAYAAASTPVAALFAVMTKVGVYAVLRLWTLCFPATAGDSALFGSEALVWGGLVTLGFGTIGMLASHSFARVVSFSIIASSGTLVAATGFDDPALTAGALFYLASATLAGAAMFLLVELLDRARRLEADPPSMPVVDGRLPGFAEPDAEPVPADANLDDLAVPLIGRAIPAAVTFLGLAFLVGTLVLAGLPPLSGFVAKLAMLSAVLAMPAQIGTASAGVVLFALQILSGLFAVIALSRVGLRVFWSPEQRGAPELRVAESLPVAALLGLCVVLVIGGESGLRYMRATAASLHDPQGYIGAVMAARPVPTPTERGTLPRFGGSR